MISNVGNKIFSFYTDAKKLYNGELVYPRFISMWLTTLCNLGCAYCFFSSLNTKKETQSLLSTEIIYKILNEFKNISNIESIEFSGGGEPTLHPDFNTIVKKAYNIGLKVGLLTNGCNINITTSQLFQYIRIGLDATTSQEYSKIKKCSSDIFDKVVSSIKELIKYRKNKRPRIGLKFMLTEHNYTNVENMVQFSLDLKVDYCHFKLVHSFVLDMIKDFHYKKVTSLIELLKVKYPNFVYGNIYKENLNHSCFLSPIHSVITSTGDVLICCYFYEKEKVIGNIYKNTFQEIWENDTHYDLIDSIISKQCNKFDCRWIKYNNEMYDIINTGKYDLSFI